MLNEQTIIGTIAYLGGVMSLPEPFTWSWGNLAVYSHEALCQAGEHIHFDRAKQSLHDYARNEILGRARGEWILMLDTDVAFDPDFAARLVMTMYKFNVDVLTGIYSYKRPPHYPVLYLWNHETDRHEIVNNWDRTSDIFQVHSAGGGCLLVRRQVFERITSALGESPFNRIQNKGEDHSFFIRCRTLGIPVYCAWKVEMAHLEYWGITPSQDFIPDPQAAHEFTVEGKRWEVHSPDGGSEERLVVAAR